MGEAETLVRLLLPQLSSPVELDREWEVWDVCELGVSLAKLRLSSGEGGGWRVLVHVAADSSQGDFKASLGLVGWWVCVEGARAGGWREQQQ